MKIEPITIIENACEVHGEILDRNPTCLKVSITSPYCNLSAHSELRFNVMAGLNRKNTLATDLGLDVAKDLLSILYQLASLLDQNWDFLVRELLAEGSRQTGLTSAEVKEAWTSRKGRELQKADAQSKEKFGSSSESGRSSQRETPWITMSPRDEKIVTAFCERHLQVHLSESLKFQVFHILLSEKSYIQTPNS